MGPNNTNTTPTGNTTSLGNASTTAFSGPAPATNPFSNQNSIPSSGSGDIILSPDNQPANKSKKGLIIGSIIAIVVIIGIAVTVLIITKQKSNTGGSDSSQGTATVSSQSLKSSFESLAKVIISGDTATGDLNLSAPSNLWQLSIINSNDSSVAQATYAETLKSANEAFSNNVKNYLSQHADQDLSSLSSNSSALTDKITASVLYLRANQFTDELRTQVANYTNSQTNLSPNEEDDPNNPQSLVMDEMKIASDMSDGSANMLASTIRLYYSEIISGSNDTNLLYSLGSQADVIFNNIITELSSVLTALNSSIGESK